MPLRNVINLRNTTFTKQTFQLLNKNLNFIPTWSKKNKNQLNRKLDGFFRLIKLKTYLKDKTMYNQTTKNNVSNQKLIKKEIWQKPPYQRKVHSSNQKCSGSKTAI